MWKFDDKELEWVVPPAEYKKDSIKLICCAFDDFKVENVATVSGEFNRPVSYKGERVSCGSFTVKYNKGDRVYIQEAFEGEYCDTVAVDDVLYIETAKGKMTVDFSNNCKTKIIPKKRINISELLEVGTNTVKIEIRDLCGVSIGTEGLVIVKESGNSARSEIEEWQEYEATASGSKLALNDVRYLQSTDVPSYKFPSYKLTDGFKEWDAVLSSVTFNEDSESDEFILYELNFLIANERNVTIEPTTDEYPQIKCYDVGEAYDNLLYSQYTDRNPSQRTFRSEIGHIILEEAFPISRVELYGKGLKSLGHVYVNDIRRFWHHYVCHPEEIGNEVLRFDFADSEELIFDLDITTSPHTQDGKYETGAKLTGLCVWRSKDDNQKVYYPKYTEYANISDYCCWTTCDDDPELPWYGIEIGKMTIKEKKEVKEVIVSGTGCNKPAWLSINGIKKYWTHYHDEPGEDDPPERLTFKLDTPSKILKFQTSLHESTWNTENYGCALYWIRVIFA